MRSLIYVYPLLIAMLAEAGPPGPKDFATVQASIRPSLQSILPQHQQEQLMETMVDMEVLDKVEELCHSHPNVVMELRQLVRRHGGLARSNVMDFVEAVMKAIMSALAADFKEMFVVLVAPLVELAVVLNPLPEYLLTPVPMDGDQEMRYIEEVFENWGSTLLTNVTVRTFFPRTVEGIQNIVKLAAGNGARVRASATRHTFNPWLWGCESEMQPGQDGQNVDYVIAMLPQEVSDHLAYARNMGSWPEDSELVSIEGPLREWKDEKGAKKAAVKFGAGTLNKHYTEWALANNWTLPSNTIMHYMSLGGVMMGTSHGGGIGHQLLADRLLEVQYVDANGELITLTDPDLIRVFGGSMGMLGIVTSLTYELDEMTYARFWPQIIKGGLSELMPPSGQPVPNKTIEYMTHYYSEFITYPTHHAAPGVMWKNTWDNLGRAEDSITLIDHLEDEFQRDYVFVEVLAVQGFKLLQENFPASDYLDWLFGYLVGAVSGLAMNDWDEPVTTTALEAMHFQRGLHYLSVRAAEMNVPIPALEDGTPDWDIVQQVVYDLATVVASFEDAGKYPIDLAIEDRFMGGTEMLLGAQYGNSFTLSIEATSSPLVSQDLWEEFKEAMASNWENYSDRQGNKLVVRPHWAKEFPRSVAGTEINEYMRKVFAPQLPRYVEGMKALMEVTGGDLTSTLNMFNTKYMEKIMEGYL